MKDHSLTPARLLTLYERVAEAEDAIPRLRRFVLDLAVRGKLVPQDPADEPASELLRRIAAEKARLVEAEEIKREKGTPTCAPEELGSPIPAGWSVASLAQVTACLDYMRVPVNSAERDQRISDKEPKDLYPYFGATQQQGWIDSYLFDAELVLLGEDGVPFHDPFRTKAYIIRGKTWVNNHAHVFRPTLVSADFLCGYLNVFDYSGRIAGATRAKLNQAQAITIPVPLPPLAEQHRIVARVGELMALLDRLEAARAVREETRTRLTTATLSRLTAPDTPEDAHAATSFALSTLPALTTRPDQIKTLRQTILNLAVRGRLVKQDPADEPALVWLMRLFGGDPAHFANSTRDSAADTSQELPAGWCWSTLGAMVASSDAGWSPKTLDHPRAGDAWGVLKVSAVSWGRFDPTANKQVMMSTEPRLQAQINEGDFLISRANTAELVARAVIVDQKPINLMMSDKIVRLKLISEVCGEYLLIVNNHANFARSHYASNASGTSPSMKNVSRGVILGLPIPLPPLAEQHRIVARVESLMSLCDRLEAALQTSATTRARLLEATLREALAETGEAA